MIRDGGNPILIAGTGTIRWGSRPIVVAKDGIKIDGVPVESLPEGHRNAVIDKDGTIRKDRFIPFEPWWGIHSSWW